MNDVTDTAPDDDDAAEVTELVTRTGDLVEIEIPDFGSSQRTTLDGMLVEVGVTHSWQGATLLVPVDQEGEANRLIEEVAETGGHGLDPSRSRVVYEVAAWSAAMQTSLGDALTVAGIEFEWDTEGDLVAYEDDEEEIEEILDAMPDPDDPDAEDADGLDVQEVIGGLWMSTTRLEKRSRDHDAVLTVVDLADRIERMSLPFGFEPRVWRGIVADATALRDLLELDEGLDPAEARDEHVPGDRVDDDDRDPEGREAVEEDGGEERGEAGGDDDAATGPRLGDQGGEAPDLDDRIRELAGSVHRRLHPYVG
ncbi:MAG: hypothetical protein R2698_09280 [Microthrixaceae bacterium]